MIKIIISVMALLISLNAIEIPIKKVELRNFSKKLELNAQIIQLSNSKQAIMSPVSGHIEKYFVKAGEKIAKGDKIALIESMELSNITAEYISLKKQLLAINRNYSANVSLYKKGLISMQELNRDSIKKDEISAKLESVRSKLQTLEVNTNDLKSASSKYIIYAHESGVLNSFIVPLHSVVDSKEEIVSIVKDEAYYLKTYLPLKYANEIKLDDRVVIKDGDKEIVTHIRQILPEVDRVTQQVVLLSSIDKKRDLFIGSYLPVTLYSKKSREYLAVKRSALSFFNNEWVVFVPKEEDEDHIDEHKEDDHKNHDEHEGDLKHQEVPYEARVVQIITDDGSFVAVKGLKEGEEYVSDNSYFVKSMLLKSALGGHGH